MGITSIRVDYKHVDGWHVFSSEKLPGLYVASKDAREAYEDIAPALEKLLLLNAGLQCRVTAELPFADFVKKVTGRDSFDDRPPVLASHRYAIHACNG